MISGLKLTLFVILVALFAFSQDVSAWYGSPYSYGGYYGYNTYGYAGPYSYIYTPGSFWGHYYNPGLYYSSLDYSMKNNLLDFSQDTLSKTYGFVGKNGWYN
jgi:hypothetical protein